MYLKQIINQAFEIDKIFALEHINKQLNKFVKSFECCEKNYQQFHTMKRQRLEADLPRYIEASETR